MIDPNDFSVGAGSHTLPINIMPPHHISRDEMSKALANYRLLNKAVTNGAQRSHKHHITAVENHGHVGTLVTINTDSHGVKFDCVAAHYFVCEAFRKGWSVVEFHVTQEDGDDTINGMMLGHYIAPRGSNATIMRAGVRITTVKDSGVRVFSDVSYPEVAMSNWLRTQEGKFVLDSFLAAVSDGDEKARSSLADFVNNVADEKGAQERAMTRLGSADMVGDDRVQVLGSGSHDGQGINPAYHR